MNSENGWSEEEAGMAQLDDDIGLIMQHLKDAGLDDNTIRRIPPTDNGTEALHLARRQDKRHSQSRAKGTVMEGGFRVPCHHSALAKPRAGGLGAERHLLRHGLVPHFP